MIETTLKRFFKGVWRFFLLQCTIALAAPVCALPLWALWPFGARFLNAPGFDLLTFTALTATLFEGIFVLWFGGFVVVRMVRHLLEGLLEEPDTDVNRAMRRFMERHFGW
jgi:hypothetical protein